MRASCDKFTSSNPALEKWGCGLRSTCCRTMVFMPAVASLPIDSPPPKPSCTIEHHVRQVAERRIGTASGAALLAFVQRPPSIGTSENQSAARRPRRGALR